MIEPILPDKEDTEAEVLYRQLIGYLHSQKLTIRVIKKTLRKLYDAIDSYRDSIEFN
jgi:hypothetical protein